MMIDMNQTALEP